VKVRAAALRAAREVVLGVLEELAFHLAAVVGRWRERLTGREVETAGRSGAFGPSPHGAPPPPPATPRRAPKRTAAEVEEELPEVQSQEPRRLTRAWSGWRAGRRAGGWRRRRRRRRWALGPIHVTSQLGLIAQRRLRAKGLEVRGGRRWRRGERSRRGRVARCR